jgi:hypothetical protein
LRNWPEIFDFEAELGFKRSQTKPRIHCTVPKNRHTTIPNASGPMSAWFDDDLKLLNCEIAQLRIPFRPFSGNRRLQAQEPREEQMKRSTAKVGKAF